MFGPATLDISHFANLELILHIHVTILGYLIERLNDIWKKIDLTIALFYKFFLFSLKQHNTTQLRMLSHRWHRLGLQPPILWSTQEHNRNKSVDDTRPALENSPLRVTLVVSSMDKRTDEINKSHPSRLDTCNRGCFEGIVTEQHSLNNSRRVSVECEDSDLSDLEKDNIPISKWAAPVKLDLRPDSVDRDLELTEAAEDGQVYPEVFPVPLKNFSKCSDAGFESQDPCLTSMVRRLLELGKLQAATIQREQGKAVRSRSATALVRSANRLRRVESPCSQIEHLRTSSVLADLTKLTLSSSSRSRSRQQSRPLSHSDRVRSGVQQASTLRKKTNSSAVKLRRPEGLTCSNLNVSPKCNSPNTSKIRTMKNQPKLKKTSEKSNAMCF